MQTLQNIISIQLRCFRKEGIKKFIFCLRDFDEDHESLGDLESTIRESMAEIWAQIKKPETGMKSRDIYSIEVFPFRSFRTNKTGFLEDCQKMHKKLESYRKLAVNNLPLDGFVHYLRSSWKIIQSNKDLNIPDQKRIVANVRCREEAQIIHKDGSSQINELSKAIGRKSINTLVSSIKDILKKSHDEYDLNTTFYDEKAKEEHKVELKKNFSDNMKEFLKLSYKNKEDTLKSQIELMVNKINQRKEYGIEVFNEFHQKKIDMYLQLDKYKSVLTFDDLNADEVNKEKKEKILQLLKVSLGNLYVKIVDNLIRQKMKEIKKAEEEFYVLFTKESFLKIVEETQTVYDGLEKGLKEIKEEDPMLFSEMNETFFGSLQAKVFGRIREKLQSMNLIKVVLRAFKKRFLKDKNNIPRKWKKIEQTDINTLYRQERAGVFKRMEFLGEDMYIHEDRIEFDTKYIDLKEEVETEIENIYNSVMEKHLAGNALKNIPKVLFFYLFVQK